MHSASVLDSAIVFCRCNVTLLLRRVFDGGLLDDDGDAGGGGHAGSGYVDIHFWYTPLMSSSSPWTSTTNTSLVYHCFAPSL